MIALLLAHGVYHARNAPYHPRIHNLGNAGGLGGAVHARGAWCATRLIDAVAYGGRNVRAEVADRLALDVPNATTVVDVGCGAGTMTYELARAFGSVVGVDTSEDMLAEARRRVPGVEFLRANGIDLHRQCRVPDLVVCAFLLHEMPPSAHRRLLRGLHRAAPSGVLVLVDICPEYDPPTSMLSGEPFLREYLRSVRATVREEARRSDRRLEHRVLVEGHVDMWTLRG